MLLNKAVCTVALLWGTVAAAQEAADSVRRIEEVTVVAHRYHEVIPSQRLAGGKLKALSSLSVADAIRYFSGVQMKDYGGVGGLKTIDIRSMGTNHLGVFYDGIQLGNAQNGQIDLGKFSLDNIEEIALYNGQKSEILQSAKDFGSAGTVYLRTRRPRFAEGERSHAKASFRAGSFGLLNPSILWEQKTGKKTAASFGAEYIQATGKYRFRYRKVLRDGSVAWDTTAVRQNGDIRSARLEGSVHGEAGRGQWNAKAWFYDSERGIPGAIVNNVWKRSQRQWDRNFFVQGSYRIPFATHGEALVNLKYANDWMRYLNPDTTLMYIDNIFRQQEVYASTAAKYAILPQWDAGVAIDWQWNALNASLQDFVFPQRNTVLAAMATAAQWKRFKAQASLLGTFVFDRISKTSRQRKPDDLQRFTPAVFLSYQPFGRLQHDRQDGNQPLSLRAFYKRIFRMPTFNDLYYTDIGNTILRPEYTTQYNAGFEWGNAPRHGVLSRWKVQADAYYNEVSDKIIAVPKGNGQFRWMMMNLGYVEIRGIDLSADAAWKLPLSIDLATRINYTFQKAQDFTDPTDNRPSAGSYGGQIAYIPRHSGSAIASITWRTWEANYSFIYTGERYHNSSNIRENYEQPWYTHDMAMAKTFRIKKINFKLSAELNNLLNQFYDVVLNYPMPGRNGKITLKFEI
ncbi:MAG: TonB-dependent receptor [Bacteroidales bacterium]|jgi:outer membrane cobalamin receptor|nr:TonB-dependent receptor [Bacteroidales bacterium]